MHSLNSIHNLTVQTFDPTKRLSIHQPALSGSKHDLANKARKASESQLKMINAFSLHISQRDEIQLKRGHLSRNRVHDQQIKMKQIVLIIIEIKYLRWRAD